MVQARSPHHPVISLGEAIEAARLIHRKDLQNKVSREAVSHHLGYNSINGRSLSKIGALRAYGLLEGSGDELRVSDEAVHIIADPPGSPERQVLIQSLAFRPKLFAQLRGQFEAKPSAAALRSVLIKLGFTDKGIGKATKTFLETFDLVIHEGGVYNSSETLEETIDDFPGDDLDESSNSLLKPKTISHGREIHNTIPGPGMRQDVFSLEEGNLTIQWPTHMSPDSMEMVETYLPIVLRKIKHSVSIAHNFDDDESGGLEAADS